MTKRADRCGFGNFKIPKEIRVTFPSMLPTKFGNEMNESPDDKARESEAGGNPKPGVLPERKAR